MKKVLIGFFVFAVFMACYGMGCEGSGGGGGSSDVTVTVAPPAPAPAE